MERRWRGRPQVNLTAMGTNRISNRLTARTVASSLLTCVCAGAILLTAALALAQERAGNNARASAEEPGVFGGIVRWFDRQASRIGSGFKDAGWQVKNFGHEAGIAARTTVEGAKDAAGAVARFSAARVVTGHQKCKVAPNGAPDCLAAAYAMCRAKGFDSGKSVDMTTAEVCSPQVYLSGRNSGAGCHTETFVSRALCQ
jgi:hypothetical protein